MPLNTAGLRYPHERVLLPRTRLAYINLRNLLTDAKRDRQARVFGYVVIWLPQEVVILYLQEGELVNATVFDGTTFAPIAISEAVAKVPLEPEYGEICFNEAEDEQLACMYHTQVTECEPWDEEVDATNPKVLFPYLMARSFDGVLEIALDWSINYLIVRDGAVERGYLADPTPGTLVERVRRIFPTEATRRPPSVRKWTVPPPLPIQAPPPLVQAYRDLACNMVQQLVAHGAEGAPAVAEHARHMLMERYPALHSFPLSSRSTRDPVDDAATVTAAIAEWISETLWASGSVDSPEDLLRDLTRDRRHMFQSAGLYDALPWKIKF